MAFSAAASAAGEGTGCTFWWMILLENVACRQALPP
jgi:hypothetical protein